MTFVKLLTNTYTLGMYGATDPVSGQLTWNHNGGGWAGGPWTQWITFPDGASAVIQANAPTGDATSTRSSSRNTTRPGSDEPWRSDVGTRHEMGGCRRFFVAGSMFAIGAAREFHEGTFRDRLRTFPKMDPRWEYIR